MLACCTRPHDPDCPLVCLDETSKQLLAENPGADPDETGTSGPLRLRVRAQRHRQPLHDVRAARGLAPHQNHRTPYRRGLRSRLERPGRCPFRQRQDHRSGPGQSQHPQQGVTLRSLSCRRSQAPGRAFRMARPKHGSWLDLAESELGVLSSSASTAGSPTSKPSSKKSPPGSTTATPTKPRPTGTSQHPMLVSNSSTSTPQSSAGARDLSGDRRGQWRRLPRIRSGLG